MLFHADVVESLQTRDLQSPTHLKAGCEFDDWSSSLTAVQVQFFSSHGSPHGTLSCPLDRSLCSYSMPPRCTARGIGGTSA